MAAPNACPAPPVVSSEAAICLAKLNMAASASHVDTLKYLAEEHETYWLVEYWPKDSNVRGGGGKFKIEKATGRVDFVEGYR